MGYPTLNLDPVTGQFPDEWATAVQEWIDTLRKTHFGATAPATPVEGDRWIDDTGIYRYYFNAGWHVVADATAQGSRDYGSFQALNFVMEQHAGAAPIALARLGYHVAANRLTYGDGSIALYDGGWPADGTGLLAIPCDLYTTAFLTNEAPAAAGISGGFRIANATDRVLVKAKHPIPFGWTTSQDAVLELEYELVSGPETANDDPMFHADFRMTPIGSKPSAVASTANSAGDIGSFTEVGQRHVAGVVLPRADASHPTAVGAAFIAEIYRTITQIPSVDLVGATLLVPVFSARSQ